MLLFRFRSMSRDHPVTVEPFHFSPASRWLMNGVRTKGLHRIIAGLVLSEPEAGLSKSGGY
jgi:hypothetical protein